MFNSTKHKINQAKCLRGTKNTQDFCGCQEALIGYACTHVCVCLWVCCCVDSSVTACFVDYLPSCLPHLVSKQRRAGLPAWGAGTLWRGLLSALPGGLSGSALANKHLRREQSHWAKHFLNHRTDSLGFTLPGHRGTISLTAHWGEF